MSDSDGNKPRRTNPFIRPWILHNEAADSEKNKTFTPIYALAGGLTGASELVISYPFDYIKTQLQLSKNNEMRTFKDVVKSTLEKKGIPGLYRGLSVGIVLSVPREGLRFGIYEALKNIATDENGHRQPGTFFICGFLAGFCEAAIATTPIETVKVKLISDLLKEQPKYSGFIITSILKIVKDNGFRGMYRGLVPTVLKQGTGQGIRFYVVESCKLWYRNGDPTAKIPTPVVGLFGITGGAASVIINNPIDVLKTRMQGYDYKNIVDCFQRVAKEEGYLAFYKGIKARLVRVCLDAGFTFMIYDEMLKILTKYFDK